MMMTPSLEMPFILLTAGGSGGHVFPAEALAAELIARGYRLGFATDRRGQAFHGALGQIPAFPLHAGGLAGRGRGSRIRAAGELCLGFFEALALIRRLRPAAVAGFGGYASVPAMLAAQMLGVPTILHEQNAVLGRANRFLAGRCRLIATSFEKTGALPAQGRAPRVHTGMPVRPAIAAKRYLAYTAPGSTFRLLVLGGSQGARIFSDVVPAALARLAPDFRGRIEISQQCRAEDIDRVRKAYADLGINAGLATFFDDVPVRLANAHLVITRSGASTVGELAAIGRPAILVPYPHAIDDHQRANALAYEAAGAGWLMGQDGFDAAGLAAMLVRLLAEPALLEKAAAAALVAGVPDAATRLADAVAGLIAAPVPPSSEVVP